MLACVPFASFHGWTSLGDTSFRHRQHELGNHIVLGVGNVLILSSWAAAEFLLLINLGSCCNCDDGCGGEEEEDFMMLLMLLLLFFCVGNSSRLMRQSGHVELFASHSSTQALWKMWLHTGSCCKVSFFW